MNRTFRSLIQTFLIMACALSLNLTVFDVSAQAQGNSGGSTTLSSHAATQKKRRRARRGSRSTRPIIVRMSKSTSNSNGPVVSEVKSRVDYIPPGGGSVFGEANANVSPGAPEPKPTPTPRLPRGVIEGGILNGKAINTPLPHYPAIARSARAFGTVVVQVTIDEEGRVIAARALSGHPLLQAAAVDAAYKARFSPTQLSGQPVKVRGTLRYRFAP